VSSELSERPRHEMLETPARVGIGTSLKFRRKLHRSTSKYFYLQSPGKKLLITGIIYDICMIYCVNFYVSVTSYTAASVCSQSGLGVDVVTFGNSTCSFVDQEFTDELGTWFCGRQCQSYGDGQGQAKSHGKKEWTEGVREQPLQWVLKAPTHRTSLGGGEYCDTPLRSYQDFPLREAVEVVPSGFRYPGR
jgi:hypothetical protein